MRSEQSDPTKTRTTSEAGHRDNLPCADIINNGVCDFDAAVILGRYGQTPDDLAAFTSVA